MDLRQRKKQEEVSSLTDFTVLHIEDDHIDAEWAQRAFSEYKDVNFNVEWVRTASSAKDILSKKEFDLIVLDLSLPDGFGLDLFKEIKEVSGKAAIVLFSGTVEEKAAAIEALDIGAQDYLSKDETNQAVFIKSIRYAIERNKLIQSLNRKNKELDAFSHMVSHDLKNPFTAIKATVDTLKEAASIQKVKEVVDNRVRGMSQKIDALLQFASCDKDISNKEEIDLSICLENALKNLNADIGREKAIIHREPLPHAFVSSLLVELLFQNLISNAIKFKKPNTSPEIFISSRADGDFVVVSVKDNGVGIAEDENKNEIFGLFNRAKNSQGIPGSGIGLATCRKIVESHGGKIWVESDSKQGTTFYFSLPKII
ncbi:MAG: hypothetical protein A3F16_07580 [Deltaproteobacteria bacterium RIFCSPHIGHO2_12_FULL_43_9]|nr:MAG: hypothetical protein A3F16_07580 [Deltaproteobacteria bacterium RIFCSPHIGHO2_12_FULL_43_9]